ncbi:MAG TPA: hypothetical protein EYQ54_13045 [Myxococcales bacterium]|nr:hypothetical protein [Myxococcales bacterium]
MRQQAKEAARGISAKLWKNRANFAKASWSAASGFVKEGVNGAKDSASYFVFPKKAVEDLLAEEQRLRGEYRAIVLDQPKRWRRFDTCTIGGELLANVLAARSIPPEIEAAYTAAYPNLAATQTFSESVAGLEGDQLQGLLAGVKGKLFELQYIDLLNGELLPDGYVAELAVAANQQGWDIAIVGPDGSVADVLQAKATDSASYVREALERYPEIDVVTTDEVYSQLLLSGGGEDLIQSGVTNSQLDEIVGGAADTGVELDFNPPLLGFALIGLTTIAFEDGGIDHKARVVGSRCGRAYPAWMVGKTVAAISGPFWWLSIPAGMGVRYIADEGRNRRENWAELRRRVRSHKSVLSRFRSSGEDGATTSPAL